LELYVADGGVVVVAASEPAVELTIFFRFNEVKAVAGGGVMALGVVRVSVELVDLTVAPLSMSKRRSPGGGFKKLIFSLRTRLSGCVELMCGNSRK
jgi:hypothetical protein